MAKNGRPPADPIRDLIIYMEVESARKMQRPKHPGLEPVPLSWDKAYEIAQFHLAGPPWSVALSVGAIRAAYARGKKLADRAQKQIDHTNFKLNTEKSLKKSAKNP
jgi:hypothetical protein